MRFLPALVILFLPGISGAAFSQPLPPGSPAIVISEIMYHSPQLGEDNLEFIEIQNPSATSERSLSGHSFVQGIEFTFPIGFLVQPLEYVIIAKDSVAFENTFGIPALQWTSGDLDDAGETIIVKSNFNETVDSIPYTTSAPWPTGADGNGASIVLCIDSLDNSVGANWSTAATNTGIIINGIQIHANPGASCSVNDAISEADTELFSIYPNPNNGNVFLSANAANVSNAVVEIFSTSGHLIARKPLGNSPAEKVLIASGLESGIYLVRLSSGAQVSNKRMVVIR
ncbi:MAG: lamin tail domain-containing protein [Flavobacteriales bacterium]|nr:lamin tail domain-containing protein [Flavobacteriales bacterium]